MRIKFSWLKLVQSLSEVFGLLPDGESEKLLDATTNCGRWSETVAARFLETESRPRILEKMLLISVLELLVTLYGWITFSKNVWEERESRNSLVGAWWSYFSWSTLKSSSRTIDFLYFEILSKRFRENWLYSSKSILRCL